MQLQHSLPGHFKPGICHLASPGALQSPGGHTNSKLQPRRKDSRTDSRTTLATPAAPAGGSPFPPSRHSGSTPSGPQPPAAAAGAGGAASAAGMDSIVDSSASTASGQVDLTELASRVLTHGSGLARRVLSDPELEGNPLDFLKQTEAFWKAMKQQKHEPHKPGPTVITTSNDTIAHLTQHANTNSSSSSSRPLSFGAAPAAASHAPSSSSFPSSSSSSGAVDFDVVMAGGTLGICVALALQQAGFRVAVVERRRVEGRLQEWNSSRHELQVLVDLGLLTQSELEAAVVSEFNPIRVGFKGGAKTLTIDNILNIGVCPKTLIATMRSKFEVLGGVVYEDTAFKTGVVGTDGVVVNLASAAGAPADVGDTNRPNAVQQQRQQGRGGEEGVPLHSPFGRVVGEQGVVAGHREAGAVPAAAAVGGVHHSSSHSSRFDRWATVAAAATAAAGGGASAQLVGLASSSSSSHTARTQQTNRGAAAAAAGQLDSSSSRKAPKQLTCRLLLDCMGHYSPIVKQLRGRAKPDGMVLVVGGCATGFTPEANTSADLLYSITDASADMQLFWEAFPAEGGKARTTYMFAYADADPARPSFEKLLDTYFTLMPAYQGLPSLEAVKYKRILFGGFPCYSSTTPLAPGFDRVLQLGDASASQSPLSFGGFGSLLRHLPRLTRAISHALTDDKLSRRDLSWVHPYQPSLSAAWLFQRSMSMPVGQMQQQQQQGQQQQGPQQDAEKGGAADSSAKQQQGRRQLLPHVGAASGGGGAAAAAAVGHDAAAATAAATAAPLAAAATAGAAGGGSDNSPAAAGSGGVSSGSSSGSSASAPGWLRRLLLLPADHINALLGANFAVMAVLGQRVLKPFLQDTLQLGPLAATMLGMMLVKPLVIARVFVQVGPKVLLGWFGHFAMLTLYTLGHTLLRPLKHLSSSYSFQRLLDALQYGSSSDYRYSSAPSVAPSTASTADSSSSGSSSHSVREDHRVVDSSYGGQQAGGQQPAETGVGREEEEQQHVLVGAGGSSGRDGTGGVRTRGAVVVANNIVPGMRSGAMVHHFQQHQPPQQQQPSAA